MLQAQRAGVEQDRVAVVESMASPPVVRSRDDRHLVEGCPVLDHRHPGFIDTPASQRSHEVVTDDHDPFAGAHEELLDLLEHRPDDRSDCTRTTGQVLAHRHAVDVLLPEHDRDTAHHEIQLDHESGNQWGVGGDHDIGPVTFREATETNAIPELVAQSPHERILREVVTEMNAETREAGLDVGLADGTVRCLERRAVHVGHQPAARCERTCELYLERVPGEVVHENPTPTISEIGSGPSHRLYATDDVGDRVIIPPSRDHPTRGYMMRLAVCALTYHRPEGLRRLLHRLEQLEVPHGNHMFVVIVDNDPEGSARELVESVAEDTSWDVLYENELERGISAARNAAVRSGLNAGADAIVFIDDDEWPDADWLAEFIATQHATGADIVTGPVLPVFDEPAPHWVLAGGFFDRPRFPHNSTIPYATTSSVLMMSSCFDGRPVPFDPDFGLSGGSDTHLFAELSDAGCVMAWSDRAIVYEAIPASRVEASWLVRREYRRGQTLSRSLRRRNSSGARLFRRAVRGVLEMLTGCVGALVGVVGGRHHRVRGAQRAAFGAGMITGLLDFRYDEYRTIHGR